MILLYLLISLMPLCYGQNAALSFECPGADTLTIKAVYSGTGTPLSVIWTFSGSSLTIETGGCTVFGTVPASFPDISRLSYKCVTTDATLPVNTYQLLVSGLQDDVLGKTWAVTFTPPAGIAPAPVSLDAPSDCSGSVRPKDCEKRVIASIVFGSLGIIVCVGVIICIVTNLSKPVCLTVAVLCIVFDIISLAVSASVQTDDDCKDSEDWILNSAIAFVVIPSIVAVTAIVFTILVLLGVIGPGGNDGNIGNNGDHHGHGTNSSTVHSEREDTHRGTLSDRPMPPIPLTDKKGRGLSANYDDDHPMINVGIPERRAGDLGPLAEEPKKKKKKKNKAVNDDDV